jgi:hypothetical protein
VARDGGGGARARRWRRRRRRRRRARKRATGDSEDARARRPPPWPGGRSATRPATPTRWPRVRGARHAVSWWGPRARGATVVRVGERERRQRRPGGGGTSGGEGPSGVGSSERAALRVGPPSSFLSLRLSLCPSAVYRLPSTIYRLPPATCHLPPDTYRLPNCLSRPGPLTHHHPHTHTQHLRPPLWTPSTATPVHVERSPTHSDEKRERERERERVRVRLTQRGLPADALVYSQFPLNVCRPRKRGRAAA